MSQQGGKPVEARIDSTRKLVVDCESKGIHSALALTVSILLSELGVKARYRRPAPRPVQEERPRTPKSQ